MYCEKTEAIENYQSTDFNTHSENINDKPVLVCLLDGSQKKQSDIQQECLPQEVQYLQPVKHKLNSEFAVMYDHFCDMESARYAFVSVLFKSPKFLQVLTMAYLEMVSKGTKLTNIIHKKKSDENATNNLDAQSSSVDYHLILDRLNQALVEEKRKSQKVLIELIKLALDIHFLPVFLEKVHQELLHYCSVNTIDKKDQENLHRANKNIESFMSSRNIIINHNMRLVTYLARKYRNANVDFNDQIQDGLIGLIKAVDRFTLSKGTQFSTYATYWIRQSITRGQLDHSKEIRLPYHTAVRAFKVFDVLNQLKRVSNKRPSVMLLAKECNMTREDVEAILTFYQPLQSIYSHSTGNDELPNILDSLEQTVYPSQEESISQEKIRENLALAIGTLPEREATIINHRFGINSETTLTLDDIASMFNISRERVRQIQNSALKKLRKQLKEDFSCDFNLYLQS
jgi:RNA polymerase primary sigma factor